MIEVKNLFTAVENPAAGEVLEQLLHGQECKLERIVSHGHATPEGHWYDQDTNEWVVLLAGAARLRFEDDNQQIELTPGDHVDIPAHSKHRVEWTDPIQVTVWLALHYD